MKQAAILAAVFIASIATAVEGKIITRCGASNGYSFYFEGPVVPHGKAGWHDDGITDGNIQLVQDGDQFDLIYTDAVGTRSATSAGFTVLNIPQAEPGFVIILAVQGQTGAVEHYLFRLDASGRGTVAWGTLRGSAALIQKSSLFSARCESP